MSRGRTILVTGGTGTLGRAFADAADEAGHRVRIMSRRPASEGLSTGREWARADVVSGAGLDDAVRGVDVVLHAATDPVGDPEAVDVEGTRRLLETVGQAGGPLLVYPSIVGIDRVPYFYYDAKEAAEALIAGSGMPHVIVRITQFHSFVDRILSLVGTLPIMPLPTRARIQSIAVEEAADCLLDRAEAGPVGRTADVAGPEVLTLGEMARAWARARDKRRWIVRVPIPGKVARGFREGRVTAPDRAVGSETWEEWLEREARGSGQAQHPDRRDARDRR